MNAVSLIQPWAQLIVDGRKPDETRSWVLPGKYRGVWLALHASKSDKGFFDALEFGYCGVEEGPGGHLSIMLPLGAIVGLVLFGHPRRTERAAEGLTLEQQSTGDYTPGRWAWPVEEYRKLATPVPCRGALGIWDVPADVVALIEAQR